MTPSVAASATVVTAALHVSGSTAVHDREWWGEEAVHDGTDWYGVVTAALEMLVTAGIIEQPEPKTMTTWDGPSWRASAKDYHEQRASRAREGNHEGRRPRVERRQTEGRAFLWRGAHQ